MANTYSGSQATAEQPRLIELPRIYDPRGNLTFVQNADGRIPFDIKRVFWTYDVPADAVRGSHAHYKCCEFLVALSGSFDVKLFDGVETRVFTLNRPYVGLYIPAGQWRTLENFSSGCICVAMASDIYEEEDYIREYDDFLKLKKCSTRS